MPLNIDPIVTHVVVHYQDGKDHAMHYGFFMGDTEDFVEIEGTLGKYIRERIFIPKARIIFIEKAKSPDEALTQ